MNRCRWNHLGVGNMLACFHTHHRHRHRRSNVQILPYGVQVTWAMETMCHIHYICLNGIHIYQKKKERNSTHTEYKENDIIWNFTVHSFTTLIMIRIKIFNEREIGNTNNLYHTRHISDISMAEESRKSMVFCFVCNAVLAILPHFFALHIYTIHECSKMLRKSYPKCRFFCWCDANWRWQWKVLSQTLHVRDSSGDFFKTRPQKEHIEQGEDKKNVE